MNKKHKLFIAGLFILLHFNGYSQQEIDKDAADFLSEFIQKKSITGTEKKAGTYLLDFCKSKGLYTRVFSDGDSTFNFCASLYPLSANKPNIIFLNHLDVVPAGDTNEWKYPPFSGTIADSMIYGRGAIDCKGLAVMQLFSLLRFIDTARQADLPYNVSLLVVSGEEEGNNNGSEFVTGHFLNELNPAVVFGEGGSGVDSLVPSKPGMEVFGISVAEKKALWLRLEARSKNYGHGAAPQELYANKRLVKALIRLLDEKKLVKFDKLTKTMFKDLGKMEGGINGFVIRHIYWGLFRPFVKSYFSEGEPMHLFVYNTFVITNIYNPTIVNNEVAEKAYATLDCRLLPEMDTGQFIRKIRQVAGPKISVSVISESPGARPSDINTIYYRTMSRTLQEVYPGSSTIPILFPATTDNNYFRRNGIPVYGIIPAVLSGDLMKSVHNINERIPVNMLTKGIDAYTGFLKGMLSE